MAFSINRAILVGNISQTPDLKYTPKGTAVLKFGFATNHSIKEQDGSYRDIPTFHNIVVWAKQAEGLSKVLNKGQKAYIEGRIENRSYVDKDNNKKYISEIVADSVISLENKSSRQETPADIPEHQAMNENINPDEISGDVMGQVFGDDIEKVESDGVPF